MKEGSVEFWEWFYEPAVDDSASIEERWHPDLVMHQAPELPGTAGEFHGYEGLRQINREMIEAYEEIRFQPKEARQLDDGRWLVLLTISGRGRGSGIELEGEIGHLVTLRDGRASRMDVYMGWDVARKQAGLD